MQSTWRGSASAATRAMSAAKVAKSGARIDGAIFVTAMTLPTGFQHQDEHPVGAGVVREQQRAASMRTPWGMRRVDRAEAVERGPCPLVDPDGLVFGDRAHAVDEAATGTNE